MSSPTKKPIATVKDIKATAPDVPLDYSFLNLQSVADILTENPVTGQKKSAADQGKDGRRPVSIRLSNNHLKHLDDFADSLQNVFCNPSMLQWVDLSANELTSISTECFGLFPNISTLHLHSNYIAKFKDIDNIAKLTKLRALTLHGNPVEEKKHYRSFTIHKIPSLNQLDFSPITKMDREKAEAWSLVFRRKLEQRGDIEEL